MPTTAEIRERASMLASRVSVLGRYSMQQVRHYGSRGMTYGQQRLNAFNRACRSRKSTDPQNWSSSTSERNSQNRDSSKKMREIEERMLESVNISS